ncbi:MAG TPA: hypothetical protein VK543_01575, partial [Puia sp.]|nr:hypothetical protein [Puia sp.]
SIVLLLTSICTYCQDMTIDSLIHTRKTDSLEGKVKTYYSPGHKEIAADLQQLVSNAILYYENKYSVKFNIQMIVLDSTQWFKEVIPYGFVFYDGTHWLVLNTGMDYSNFKTVYGLNGISKPVDSSLRKNNMTAEEMINARLKFLSLHELGHYFINKLFSAQAPNTWTNEFIAWYFANEYITQFEPKVKRGFHLFCQTILKSYPADHRTLSDFDSLYFKMKIGNFAWYHSRFYFLADALYACSGKPYLNTFQVNFPRKEALVYKNEQINQLIEANCTGLFTKWENETVYPQR